MPKLSSLILAVCFAIGLSSAAYAETLRGKAFVVDGDTLEIDGRHVRLVGIDAPEGAQEHKLATGGTDFLGRGAALMLRSLVRENDLRCALTGQRDDRGMALAQCFSGTVDVGAEMIANGMAMASASGPSPYAKLSEAAKQARKGFWRDQAEAPWAFRARKVAAAKPNAPNGCVFKAKVGKSGERILLTPWSPWYGRTRIDQAKGDRWFCDEATAVADGWRAPRWLMQSVVSGVYNPEG